jgi:hypothetical protein
VATLLTVSSPNSGRHVETYEITNGNLVAISVVGGIINGGVYTYDKDNGTVNRFVSGSDGPKGYDYGRKPVNAENTPATWTNTSQNKFCYRLNATGDGYEYDTDLDFSSKKSTDISTSPSGTDS